jgi:glycosyltransferase involved in cell wall biosynthesis
MTALSIVVPVYNGAKTIVPLVEAVSALDVDGGLEIVLVNDGSDDDSARVCEGLVASSSIPMIFVDLARNFGEHNAVLTGLRHASGAYVVTMDDDLQQPAEEVVRLYRHTKESGLDAVFGNFETRQYAAWRNWGSLVADRTATVFLGKPPDLIISSFRCLGRRLVDELVAYRGPYPYLDGMILKLTRRVENLTVEHRARESGKSNYTLRRLVRLWSHVLFNFSVKPLRISLNIGVGFFGLALLGVLYVLIDFLAGTYYAPGWASLMIFVLVFSALQFIFLGLIGEYVGRIYMSVGGLPQASVARIVRRDDGGQKQDA